MAALGATFELPLGHQVKLVGGKEVVCKVFKLKISILTRSKQSCVHSFAGKNHPWLVSVRIVLVKN